MGAGRRRSRKKGPPLAPSPRPPAQDLLPLPPGSEVEVRVDDDGFYGAWFEATVVGPAPAARGRGAPARYTVAYTHLASEGGATLLAEPVAPSRVRSRPPRPPGLGSSSSPPPRFLLHDIVEAFECNGWCSGIVVAPADPEDSPVTVAFPVTREVIPYPPHLLRPRRNYVGGEWVPSRSVIAVKPKRAVRVYQAGEKVEVLREREAYGDSWFPATVAKVVDRLSYIVEYVDDQEDGGRATEYLHWGYIRPTEYHCPRESKVQLGPGTAVEVYCDGAWSQGVVRRFVWETCEYEVSVNGKEAEQLLTKAAEQLRPLYMWNGKHWSIESHKRQANSRQQSASQKGPSSPVVVASSDDEHSGDPESSTTKRSRKEPQQIEVTLDEGSEHASVSKMDTSLSALRKSLVNIHSLNSSPPLSEKNHRPVLPHKIVSTCSVPKNGLLCASSGHSAPPDESIPNVIGETEFTQDTLSEMVHSGDPLNTPLCGRNANEACDMLLIAEVRKLSIASSLRNQQTQETPLFVKALNVKKGICKNKRLETHSMQAHQRKNDASDYGGFQLQENINFSRKEIICASSASPECQTSSALTQQVSRGTNSSSGARGVTYKKLARKQGTGSELDEEVAARINSICQVNRNADLCMENAATQVTKRNPLTELPIPSFDHLVQQNGSKVDGVNILHIQDAGSSQCTSDNTALRSCSVSGSSIPSHLAFSQIPGHQIPFIKRSPAWSLINAMDVFKKVPQEPHFHPLKQFLPALREGMALGLMVTFASLVENISKSSIADSMASFEEKIGTLRHLEENGFDVQFLQCSLMKLLQMKSDYTNYLVEKDQLKAQMLETTTSLSQIDAWASSLGSTEDCGGQRT